MKTKILLPCFGFLCWTALMYAQPRPCYPWLQNHPSHVKVFICRYDSIAIEVSRRYGIPPSMILAVAALESGWDHPGNALARQCFNLFGMKKWRNVDSLCCKVTNEYSVSKSDQPYKQIVFACFKRYSSPEEGFLDFGRWIIRKRPIIDIIQQDTPLWSYPIWIRGLQEIPYATDPGYTVKLSQIIERYELYRFDF